MTDLTFGSLFSGIGGIDLGLERAGWKCRWQIESDPNRSAILARHWPHVPRYGKIEEVDFEQLEPVELIAGGFPCQPVSSAGKRQVQRDERWLWPHFARAIRTLRPGFAIIENVAGILFRGFGDLLTDLSDCRYDAEWQMLPAAAFGAPHLRQRMWIVAYPLEWRLRAEVYVETGTPLIFRWKDVDRNRANGGEPEHWRSESPMVRMVDGFSNGMGRIVAALGDAAIPQIPEFIGNLIICAKERTR